MADPDELGLDIEETIFEPGELVRVEDLVSWVLEGWEGVRDALTAEAAEEAAEEMQAAIDILKATFSSRDMVDFSKYEKEMSGPAEPAT